jgi:hypothetical protein
MCLSEQGRTTTSSVREKSMKHIVQAPPALTIMSLVGFLDTGIYAPVFDGLLQQNINIKAPMQINGERPKTIRNRISPIFLINP